MTKEAVIFLFIAIVVEVIATISLKLSDSFTRLVPSLVTIIGLLRSGVLPSQCEPSLRVSFMLFGLG